MKIEELALKVADELNEMKHKGKSFAARDAVIDDYAIRFATRFLAAYAEQQEPACYIVQAETEDGFEYGYSASYPESVHDYINETIQRLVDDGIKPYVMHCIPLYAAPVVPADMVLVPRNDLLHCVEYWNGSINESAMSDALTHIEDCIKAMIAAGEKS